MTRLMMIGLFVAMIASLIVIVWWEFKRLRGAPRSVSKAFKRHLNTENSVPYTPPSKEAKRGFDAWS
jgi:hypothetical protein